MMQVPAGLYDVIGYGASHGGMLFVPVLGQFEFRSPQKYLKKHADLRFLESITDGKLYCGDALWVRARLIKIFGIAHPSGHSLKTLLNFQAVAIEMGESDAPSKPPIAFVVADTNEDNGYVDTYLYSPDAAIRFEATVDPDTQLRIASTFWSLILDSPGDLGVFSDYWCSDCDDSLVEISCDGFRFHQNFLGYAFRQPLNDYQRDEDATYPFELPRKRRKIKKRRA